jgi:Leucine-rich repeat (LRR) protein
LKYNQLLNLPKEIGSMISLQKLDLSHNRLVALPNQILGLESLISLYVKENNFSAAERERIRKMRRQWLTIYLN